MADYDDDGIDKAFEGFGEDEKPEVKAETTEEKQPEVEQKPEDEKQSSTAEEQKPEEKPEEQAKEPATPETPVESEQPAPLTKDDIISAIKDFRNEEYSSSKELETTTKEVLEAYYPEGLSNTLVDEKTGKELRTPQDVVDASGGTMTIEEAAQWLSNEQFRVDQEVKKIEEDARRIAETTVNWKRDAIASVQKYENLFKAYPQLQSKVYDLMMKQVKYDEAKGVILSAPDVMDLYDTYLEPYRLAYEHSTQQSATQAVETPEPAKPSAADRMDVDGDGGQSEVDDPNDFAQQVKKELANF